MIEHLTHDGETIAIIIRAMYEREGIEFFTNDEFSQQLAYMKRPAGYIIKPHVHNRVVREVMFTQEVLFIKRGKVKTDFYDNQKNYLESRTLHSGDVILLASGGHGFHMLEDSEMIEVKQGPYAGDKDKTIFEGISPDD